MLLRRRRGIASVLAALGVLVGIQALREPPPGSVLLIVAATDLEAGHVLAAQDLITKAWPIAFPAGAAFTDAQSALGRLTAGPISAGEPLGPTRIVGPSLLNVGRAGGASANVNLVAAPVRLADADEAKLLRPGDVVDVLAAHGGGIGDSENQSSGTAGGETAHIVADGVRVLAVPTNRNDSVAGPFGDSAAEATNSGDATLGTGSLLVLAVSPRIASSLAGAATHARLSVVLRGPSAATTAPAGTR